MKYLVKLFVVTFILGICTYSLAEDKITYIDLKYVLNNSKAGKGAQDYLKKTFNEKQKEFMETEKELKKEEEKLISSKDKLTKDEYKKKSDALRKQVAKYQTDRRQALEKIGKQRTEAKKMLLSKLDPILKNYITENNISLVIDKKNIVAGKNSIDITKVIVDKLNKELPSLKIK
jgi:outer membrane protein